MAAATYDVGIYEHADLTDFVPPKVLAYQRSPAHPVKLYSFEPQNIIYSPIKRSFGAYVVDMTYHLVDEADHIDAVVPIVLQTPLMRSPWGVCESKFENKDRNGQPKKVYNLHLSFNNMDREPEIESFFKVLYAWDEHNLETARLNRAKWFPTLRNLTEDAVVNFQKRITQIRVNTKTGDQYPPRLDTKIDVRFGRISTKFFDADCSPIESSFVSNNSTVRALVKCNGMWFSNNNFSISFVASQVQLGANNNFENYSFADADADQA